MNIIYQITIFNQLLNSINSSFSKILTRFPLCNDINISKSGEDYLTLKYERLVPILLQGIKELKEENNLQQKEIKELKEENNLQQKEIDDLKLRLTRLELLL